jgi:hypothetical protein
MPSPRQQGADLSVRVPGESAQILPNEIGATRQRSERCFLIRWAVGLEHPFQRLLGPDPTHTGRCDSSDTGIGILQDGGERFGMVGAKP